MRVLPFVIALSLAPSFASAQQTLPPALPGGITFEALHPFLEDDDGVSILSGAYFLGVRYPLNERLAIIGELPFAYISVDSELGDESSSAIGNPLLGLALTRGNLEFGFAGRLPAPPDDEFAPLDPGVVTFNVYEGEESKNAAERGKRDSHLWVFEKVKLEEGSHGGDSEQPDPPKDDPGPGARGS